MDIDAVRLVMAYDGRIRHPFFLYFSLILCGLSFKANTDDIREASSLDIIEKLLLSGAKISAFDPVAMNNVKKHIGKTIDYAKDMYETLSWAYVLLS